MKVRMYRSPWGGRSYRVGLLEVYLVRSPRGRLWKTTVHLGRFSFEVSW